MSVTILDCYTDEAAGLGGPPYLGTYPRYLMGHFKGEAHYITIDDLRSLNKKAKPLGQTREDELMDISIYNRTHQDVEKVLAETSQLIVVLGVHVPGKYLTALPGTLKEVIQLTKTYSFQKILTGPAVMGTQIQGGRFFEKEDLSCFERVENFSFSYAEMREVSIRGSRILEKIPDLRIIEIETGQGCKVGKCSFCTEPLKAAVSYRPLNDIVDEVDSFYQLGARYFRLGKQTCFYSYPHPIELLQKLRIRCPEIEVLHVDNANPIFAYRMDDVTKAIVDYCSSGNIAAFGVESFDPVVTRANQLNCPPKIAMKAIEKINQWGAERGPDGLPRFLPGINIIFGLNQESRHTHEKNMQAFRDILSRGWFLRRINVRKASILPGTALEQACGNKYLRKNQKYYWRWRNQIRQEVDLPMLERLVPKGTILRNVRVELWEGKNSFGRQMGTYPLIVGIKNRRLPLKEFFDIRVTGHMLRSVVGEPVERESKQSA